MKVKERAQNKEPKQKVIVKKSEVNLFPDNLFSRSYNTKDDPSARSVIDKRSTVKENPKQAAKILP